MRGLCNHRDNSNECSEYILVKRHVLYSIESRKNFQSFQPQIHSSCLMHFSKNYPSFLTMVTETAPLILFFPKNSTQNLIQFSSEIASQFFLDTPVANIIKFYNLRANCELLNLNSSILLITTLTHSFPFYATSLTLRSLGCIQTQLTNNIEKFHYT